MSTSPSRAAASSAALHQEWQRVLQEHGYAIQGLRSDLTHLQETQRTEHGERLVTLEEIVYKPNGRATHTVRLGQIEQTLASFRKLGWIISATLIGLLVTQLWATFRPPPVPPQVPQGPRPTAWHAPGGAEGHEGRPTERGESGPVEAGWSP